MSMYVVLLAVSSAPSVSVGNSNESIEWRFDSAAAVHRFARAREGSPRLLPSGTGMHFDGRNDSLTATSPLRGVRDFSLRLDFRPAAFVDADYPRDCGYYPALGLKYRCSEPDGFSSMQKVFTVADRPGGVGGRGGLLMYEVALVKNQSRFVSWVWLRSGNYSRHFWSGTMAERQNRWADDRFPGFHAMFEHPVSHRFHSVVITLRDFWLSLSIDGVRTVHERAAYADAARGPGMLVVGGVPGSWLEGRHVVENFKGTIRSMTFTPWPS